MPTTATQSATEERESGKASIIADLQQAYSMELETVCNYLADSINLDGVRAEEIKKSLGDDIPEELGHATRLANRIKQLGGIVPGPASLNFDRSHLEKSNEITEVVTVIKAVIRDELAAIKQYKKMILACDGKDFVTQDLCIGLLADEEKHLSQFRGFLKEYNAISVVKSYVSRSP